jgi:hypothetical protein
VSVTRRAPARAATVASGGSQALPAAQPEEEITYKGYRVEPASYCVSTGAWSPRVVVSLKTEDGSSPRTPLYATNTARWPTRDEADRRALDVARAWIDAAIARQRD